MCSNIRIEKTMTEAGEARLAELTAWVAADIASGDASLKTALRLWRNDVIKRLHPRPLRPQMLQIPNIFVDHLGLKSQRVFLLRSNAVVEVWEYNRSKGIFVTGKTIVPPN